MKRRAWYSFSQAFLRVSAHLLAGYQVSGLEHVPAEGAFLLAANHKSYLDPPLLGACLPREIRYFAKKQLFRVPLLGPMIRNYGAVPVNREGFDRKGVTTALEILADGEGLLVFPEGTRIRRPGLAEPKEGIALLALRSGVPVVPAVILSTWEPRRNLLRRIPIRVRIGPPMSFGRMEPGPAARERYPLIAKAVMEAIATLMEQEPQSRVGSPEVIRPSSIRD
jgi:1-acyl-sn-glycerol-3-phosphate acyltransferase